jgi:Tfp pilus assembly protein PilX
MQRTHPTKPRTHGPGRQPQRGSSLLVVSAMLFATALMSLTAVYLSRNQSLLAGNLQHQELAFANAEATLVEAEKWLSIPANSQSAAFDTYDATKKGLYPIGTIAQQNLDLQTMAWTDTNSIANAASGGSYIVEQLGKAMPMPGSSLQLGQSSSSSACRSADLFRVTARAGGTLGANRMVETMVATNTCN